MRFIANSFQMSRGQHILMCTLMFQNRREDDSALGSLTMTTTGNTTSSTRANYADNHLHSHAKIRSRYC